MAQIVIRQLPDEVHRALKRQASEHGRSAEAEVRDIISRAVLPDSRLKAGDQLRDIWQDADVSDLTFERDKTDYNPAGFE